MSAKIRKQIYIEPRQENLLKAIAQQAGISEAEIIRQAIDLHTAVPAVMRYTKYSVAVCNKLVY